nr:hypothetical protein Iba_chr14dCG13480 [Ipomoea batatas]
MKTDLLERFILEDSSSIILIHRMTTSWQQLQKLPSNMRMAQDETFLVVLITLQMQTELICFCFLKGGKGTRRRIPRLVLDDYSSQANCQV